MRMLLLFARMTRCRAALNLTIFMLCGQVLHQRDSYGVNLLLAAVALTAVYALATSLNDLADIEIDLINLVGHVDRPLVTGTASRPELRKLAMLSAAIAPVAGFIASPVIGFLVIAEVVFAAQYSLPPVRASRRPLLAPCYMPVPCVVIPFLIGVAASGGSLEPRDALLLPALYLLFAARIVLKDFRDTHGDSRLGKRTFLLRYGKRRTCACSAGVLAASGVMLMIGLIGSPLTALCLTPFLAAILALEGRLVKVERLSDEVITIGIAARIGNGMLLLLLGMLMLQQAGAGVVPQASLYAVFLASYGYLLRSFLRNPTEFRFGSESVHRALTERGSGTAIPDVSMPARDEPGDRALPSWYGLGPDPVTEGTLSSLRS